MNKLIEKYKSYPTSITYFLNSCFITGLDVACVWILYKLFDVNVVAANTAGVLLGFVVGYILTAKFVFRTAEGVIGFAVYFVTFLIGLVLADWLIYTGETALFVQMQEQFRFLFSKGLSIVVPYFVMYFMRKILYRLLEKYKKNKTQEQ